MNRLYKDSRRGFVDVKANRGFSASERVATQLLIKALQKRLFVKSLARGVMPREIWNRLHVQHLVGSARMKEVQACEILLRAIRHVSGSFQPAAHVEEDVWSRIPEDFEMTWDIPHANWESDDEEGYIYSAR